MSDDALIVGLGNPGSQYAGTRHNIGFMCLERLAEKYEIRGKGETKFNAIVGRGRIGGRTTILVQPTTFMNLSGEALVKLVNYYKIPLEQVLVVYDEIDIPFGRLRFRPDGSAGTHNGMKSIVKCLNSQAFSRLRVGVGAPPPKWDLADYVLAPFTPEEQVHLPKIIDTCVNAMTYWVKEGDTQKAMNRYNSSNLVPPPPPLPPAPQPEETPATDT